jgi:hypothetical protein
MPDLHPGLFLLRQLLIRQAEMQRMHAPEADQDAIALDIATVSITWANEGCPVHANQPAQWGCVELMGRTAAIGRIEKISDHGISLVRVTQPAFRMTWDGVEKGMDEQVTEHGKGAIHTIRYGDEAAVRLDSARHRSGAPSWYNTDLVEGVYVVSRHAENVVPLHDDVSDESPFDDEGC